MSDTKPLNLYQKLLKITEEIGKIEKTGTNTTQNYKFIEQSRVVAEVRVQLAKYGVMILPETVSRTVDRYTTMKQGYQGKPDYEQASYHVNVVSRYTIVNADEPDEKIVCEWDAGEALDTSDKATNKATTASQKYFLMKLFNISDQDDPDSDSPAAPTVAIKATPPADASGFASNYDKSVVTRMYRAFDATDDDIRNELKTKYGIDSEHPMTKIQYNQIVKDLQ